MKGCFETTLHADFGGGSVFEMKNKRKRTPETVQMSGKTEAKPPRWGLPLVATQWVYFGEEE